MSAARNVVRRTGALCLLLAFGCSLVVEASDIDAGCEPGWKLCAERRCVAVDDPAYGCEIDDCAPCEHGPNEIPACGSDGCTVIGCVYGFGCPGCGANLLTDENNCGECRAACTGDQLCSDGTCTAF